MKFVELDHIFHESYKTSIETQTSTDPIILVKNMNMTLFYPSRLHKTLQDPKFKYDVPLDLCKNNLLKPDIRKRKYNLWNNTLDKLKIISHVPISILLLTTNGKDCTIQLNSLKSRILEIPQDSNYLINFITKQSLFEVERYLESPCIEFKFNIDKFIKSIQKLVETSNKLLIQRLDECMSEIDELFDQESWRNNVKIVIVTGHMDSKENYSFNYFRKFNLRDGCSCKIDSCKDCSKGAALFQAGTEEIQCDDDVFEFIGKHEVDQELGILLFHDFGRMHRDLLGQVG